MKAVSSNPFHVALLVLSLIVIAMCGVVCDRDIKLHPDARMAIDSLGAANLGSLWSGVAPFAAAVHSEEHLTRLAFSGQDVFAMIGDQVIDANFVNGELTLKNIAHPLSNADSKYILDWIAKCEIYGVCGYDVRTMPAYFRVFIRTYVCFVVLGNSTLPRYHDEFTSWAEMGITPRRDAFCFVTNGVFLSTERR